MFVARVALMVSCHFYSTEQSINSSSTSNNCSAGASLRQNYSVEFVLRHVVGEEQ